MSRFRSTIQQAICLILIISSVIGCGFQPLHSYNKDSQTSGYNAIEELSLTEVGWIANREGQILRQSLLRQLNPRNDTRVKKWLLNVKQSEYEQKLNVQKDETPRRVRLIQSVQFSLTDKKTGQEIFNGQEEISTSFFIPQQTDRIFSLTVSKEAARKRSLKLAAQSIIRKLLLYFNNPEIMGKRSS